jgi:hypothetical protein
MTTYWAVSSIGWGKGSTIDEAVDNYVKTQLRNYSATSTIFRTKPKWEAALRSGEASPDVWQAPSGVHGFVIDHRGMHWTNVSGTIESDVEIEQLVRESWSRQQRNS